MGNLGKENQGKIYQKPQPVPNASVVLDFSKNTFKSPPSRRYLGHSGQLFNTEPPVSFLSSRERASKINHLQTVEESKESSDYIKEGEYRKKVKDRVKSKLSSRNCRPKSRLGQGVLTKTSPRSQSSKSSQLS